MVMREEVKVHAFLGGKKLRKKIINVLLFLIRIFSSMLVCILEMLERNPTNQKETK